MALIETPTRIEPCLLDEASPAILDLVAELSRASGSLDAKLHPRSAANLAELVRIMNCYYSNLIEGHNTTPREIERALNDQLDADQDRRDLQIEARAHIRVQREIDRLFAAGTLPEPTSTEFILWLHGAFYEGASEKMLRIKSQNHDFLMQPGAFRSRPEEDVAVGRHIPPSSACVPAFMEHFAQAYRFDRLGAGSRIMAIPAAHHRLNYIHPFPDGNGRVSRLMSHAMALKAGIGAHGLWSISRGMARGLESRGDYKRMMDHADTPRQGDLDGRGNLSRRALAEFTEWFLKICVDQVAFMSSLFELDTLARRLRIYVERHDLKPEAVPLLEQVLHRGEIPRGEAARVTGLKERSARDLLASLTNDGILDSDTPKGPVSLRFTLDTADILFPTLFPET
ncbi:MAG: Fic family protein [Alphaproteobacteria bacterium]|nr:Fic family protein [Alphaproteobacteria bacterium]MBU6474319.1 Fic family protein [Alphaproteobacteria bacterium]MDE2013245.1 Fic family protein [Alphaproteobacteria bacterium]MDE2073571.1 Fic family protein [Alphaproteobacteria bacterium]